MAKTKAELCGEVTELSAKLSLPVPDGLEKLNNLQLAALVEDLENKATTPGGTNDGPPPPAAANAAAPAVDASTPPPTPLGGAVRRSELPDTPGASLLPSSPDAAGNVLDAPPRELRPLPDGHKRPTIAEFVAAGYKAENYDRHMAEWEAQLTGADLPDPPTSPLNLPPTALVDGTDSGTLGGRPKLGEKLRSSHPFSVAEGRSVVCLKGPIGAFQRIRAMDLAGGEERLAELVANGDVDDNRPKA